MVLFIVTVVGQPMLSNAIAGVALGLRKILMCMDSVKCVQGHCYVEHASYV